MTRAVVLTAAVLAACSGSESDTSQVALDASNHIGAAAMVRAYAQDADEADVKFVGHWLVISGDVVQVGGAGRNLLLTTGSSPERLPAAVISSPHLVSPHDLVTLRCDKINRAGSRPKVSNCTITAIIPARIAQSD